MRPLGLSRIVAVQDTFIMIKGCLKPFSGVVVINSCFPEIAPATLSPLDLVMTRSSKTSKARVKAEILVTNVRVRQGC